MNAPASDAVVARSEAARRIAVEAGRRALAFFESRGELVVESKGTLQDWVSRADRDVETWIRAAVLDAFPGDGLVGEEHGVAAGTSGWTWVIDPIDGTLPFLTDQPNWCVSIAVVDAEGIAVGVIHAPVLRETYSAVRGGGARLGERRLAMDPTLDVTAGNVAIGATQTFDADATGRFVAGLYRAGGVMFRIGSGALMLGYLAAGRLAGYYDPRINAWDCYAGLLIVREAGGTASFDGDIGRPGVLFAGSAGVVATLADLHARAIAPV
ncbi:inositol monophosphatase family protein [Oharaeibacter diazotrophicus]|uniref:Myo-inositol-1(Or 4)-monophosphatase n=1 Tax=Oharaeibacter diazotrophicus TaxID=1920512 RepID=A0A4R6RMD0_9HYPH|nr:inositol monophosphatase [Oharaeibacter diazotrophicus]TDP87819.1 myo-inositol-1(or 4)-monophosphatase [Oharaeibacter diazotrophicus]BBE74599.1 inositol-1-monophosphatase [Pleomorphomonas sp. SM30]GLS76974.1 inositol monophosphatase [Oharaeibacter diazotrophicus]